MDFILREWEIEDAISVAKYANNKKIADNLRDAFPYPYTLSNAMDYIGFCINADRKKNILRAITIDGVAVGSIGVFGKDDVYRKSAELGYWLAEDFWNKGIITRAIKHITEIAFNDLDIVRIFAEPYFNNIGSRKVLEKSGFELEGILRKSVYKHNRYLDSCIYSIIKK